ncbi:MAG: hypothetical protein CVT48_04955 [Thermoplasmata archaeon HGW-Thermoplasmata-1]|nr:MAG: hypothetical protein CVT48_04955 [Thermoplasmata archaeon HGW-Thermoplasmata-1]
MRAIKRAGDRAKRNECGASEIIGVILLVGIVVILFSVISILVFSKLNPSESPTVSVVGTIYEGGSGSTTIWIEHKGGNSLTEDNTVIIRINGSDASPGWRGTFAEARNSPYFTFYDDGDNLWEIGEVFTYDATAAGYTGTGSVNVLVVNTESNSVIYNGLLTEDIEAPAGNQPPVAGIVGNPTTGDAPLLVTFGLSGTDGDGVIVSWRLDINDDGSADYSGAGEPPATQIHTYTAPDTYVARLTVTDNGGASDSDTETVVVSGTGPALPATTYVNEYYTTYGTVSDFANMQNGTDGGAYATIKEQFQAGSGASIDLAASSVISSSGWTDPTKGYLSDNQYAYTASQNNHLRYGIADSGFTTGTISHVYIEVEQHISNYNNDQFTITPYFGGSAGTSATYSGSGADTTITYEITSQKSSWTWADIDGLSVNVMSVRSGGQDGTWFVDYVGVSVDYTSPSFNRFTGYFNFTGVPAATDHLVELRYNRNILHLETYGVYLWDGSGWNLRGTLSATGWTTWQYTLTSGEYNGGSPRIRLNDNNPYGAVNGQLQVDYLRIYSS